MSQENVDIVRAAWEAFDAGDVDRAFEVFAANVDWHVPQDSWGEFGGSGHYRGVGRVAGWLADMYGAWEPFELDAEEISDAGDDRVIVVLSARGREPGSGLEVEHHPAGVTTLSARKVLSVVWHPTREAALQAVGAGQ